MSAFVALSTLAFASNSNEPKANGPKANEIRDNALPGCWSYGVPKVTTGKNDNCPTVECLAPFDNCCIELTDGNFMVTLDGQTLIFRDIEILNPGDENGHGVVITGCLR